MRLANFMATAKLVPVALQKSPADCLMVVLQAIRWRMDPFMVAQECSVIQNKLMYSGKLVAAVVSIHAAVSHNGCRSNILAVTTSGASSLAVT